MNYVGNKRLLKLAEFLENNVSDRGFDLCVIAKAYKDKMPGCVTAACAIGYMPRVFPRHCKYKVPGRGCNELLSIAFPRVITSFELNVQGKGKFKTFYDFEFAERFFNITMKESGYLFQPYAYGAMKGRKTVARRIRKLVRDGRILD
jgi:hypothetical protein